MSGNRRWKIRPTCLQKGGTGKIPVPPTQVGQVFGWVTDDLVLYLEAAGPLEFNVLSGRAACECEH